MGFRQIGFFRQRSVGVHSDCCDLSNSGTDLLEHLLAGSKFFIILVESLLLLGQRFLLNLVVKQLFE